MSRTFKTSWDGDFGDGLTDTVAQELRQIGVDQERLMGKTIGQKATDQGDLRNSVAWELRQTSRGFQLRTGPDAKHAIFVLEGTRPHWAPIAPLKAWARRQLGDPQAGYAVQWKIAKRGTPAIDYLRATFAWTKKNAVPRLESAIADHLNDQ